MSSSSGKRRSVGPYVFIKSIGKGAFARVWLASHRETGVKVAIKSINKQNIDHRKKQEQLDSEVSIMQQLQHPNIVKYLGITKTERHVYIILEYVEGGDVGAYLKEHGAVDMATAQRLLRQLVEGLRFMRENNFVHRDLKPQNLLLTSKNIKEATLKIADFGFARDLHPENLAATLCGSPLYMAPEILAKNKYDAKADLWSVGTILFELVTGKPPYNGSNILDLQKQIMSSSLRFPPNANIPDECKDLLKGLLTVNPSKRIDYAQLFAHPFVAMPAASPEPNLMYSADSNSSNSPYPGRFNARTPFGQDPSRVYSPAITIPEDGRVSEYKEPSSTRTAPSSRVPSHHVFSPVANQQPPANSGLSPQPEQAQTHTHTVPPSQPPQSSPTADQQPSHLQAYAQKPETSISGSVSGSGGSGVGLEKGFVVVSDNPSGTHPRASPSDSRSLSRQGMYPPSNSNSQRGSEYHLRESHGSGLNFDLHSEPAAIEYFHGSVRRIHLVCKVGDQMNSKAEHVKAVVVYVNALLHMKKVLAQLETYLDDVAQSSHHNIGNVRLHLSNEGRHKLTSFIRWIRIQFHAYWAKLDNMKDVIDEAVRDVAKPATQLDTSAQEILYRHALDLAKDGAVEELMGNVSKADKKYRRALRMFEHIMHEGSLSAHYSADLSVMNSYFSLIEARVQSVGQKLADR